MKVPKVGFGTGLAVVWVTLLAGLVCVISGTLEIVAVAAFVVAEIPLLVILNRYARNRDASTRLASPGVRSSGSIVVRLPLPNACDTCKRATTMFGNRTKAVLEADGVLRVELGVTRRSWGVVLQV